MNPPGVPYDDVALGLRASTGHRIAGALMIVNAALVLCETYMMPASTRGDLLTGSFPIAALIDVALGVSLLSGSTGAVTLSIVRVGLGLVLFTLLRALTGEWLAAGMQVGVSLAFLLLLVGHAKRVRIGLAALLFGLYLALESFGLYILVTGQNPLAHAVMSARGELTGEPAGDVVGGLVDYRLRAPSDRWYLRTDEAARRDNPLADRWLVRPDLDAHILIIAERVPDTMVPLAPFVDTVVGNMRSAASNFELIDSAPLPGHLDTGKLLHMRASVDGQDVEYLAGLVTAYGSAFQLIGFTGARNFAAVEPELRAAIESFVLPASAALPQGAGRVVGSAAPYAVTAPDARWITASPEMLAQQNPDSDRWLVRPDVDAHVTVMLEPLGEETAVDALMQQLPERLRSTWPTATLQPAEPLAGDHAQGQVLHASVAGAAGAFEIDYAIYVVGLRAFHLLATAPAPAYPGVQGQLRQVLRSFEPPGD
ncbi:hypothetical protein [Nannocystis bainbridge]|uniref:Uncharacterized protein n=1 Tax=Nannocystis bainbridge TaxID=2995303 RepID=A0ABT5E6A2_9BACT|nr:hypothetical protein [Nannocystis bainbridge]MDC0720973.1 hypothetical protein [Nannocystis bainbridge]